MCGGVEVEDDGRPLPESLIGGRQGRLVLAYLVCERHRPVSARGARRAAVGRGAARIVVGVAERGDLPPAPPAHRGRPRRPAVVASTAGAYQLLLPAGSRVDLEELVAAVEEAEERPAAARPIGRSLPHARRGGRGAGLPRRRLRVGRRAASHGPRPAGAGRARAVGRPPRCRRGRSRDRGGPRRASISTPPRRPRTASSCARWPPPASAARRCASGSGAGSRWSRSSASTRRPRPRRVYLEILDATPPAPVTTAACRRASSPSCSPTSSSRRRCGSEHPTAMAAALERHDALVGEVVAAHGGTLLKSKLEGDATVSVFARATACAAAALALLDALDAEPWPEGAAPRLRMAMHTGEAFERGGDYFGPALNRAARLRSLAGAGEVLLSQAVAELVRDHLPDDVRASRPRPPRPARPVARRERLRAGRGPPMPRRAERRDRGRRRSSDRRSRPRSPARVRSSAAATSSAARRGSGESAAAGEPAGGVHRRRAGRRQVAAGRRARAARRTPRAASCSTAAATRTSPRRCSRSSRRCGSSHPRSARRGCRAVRGVDELGAVVPELAELLGRRGAGVRADPDTERLALFDAVTQLLRAASSEAPVLLVLDDLHWAGKTTLSLLRHLLRGAEDDAAARRRHLPRHRARAHPPAGRDARRPPPRRRRRSHHARRARRRPTSPPTSRRSATPTAPSGASWPRSPRATRSS